MVETVIRSVGAGGDFATLAEFAAALPADLVSADQRWVAELSSGSADPGGAVINCLCDTSRHVVVRAAPGEGPDDRMDPATDPLAPAEGSGAMVRAGSGDAITAAGTGTAVHVESLQVVALAGAALADDGAGAIVRVERCLLEGNSAAPAVSVRGPGGRIAGTAVIQRGPGDGIALAAGTEAEGCTVLKPERDVADGFGISFSGAPAPLVSSTVAVGYRQAFGPGAGPAAALASDQMNVLGVPDDFADPYWTAVSATVDAQNTVPGPFGVPLQWLGNNQNAFSRFDGPVVATVGPGGRFALSLIVAQPTALVSAILLDTADGRPELRVTWSDSPPTITQFGTTATFALMTAELTDLGGGAWRLFLEAENTGTAPLDVTPSIYVTRGAENSGLSVGFFAGAMMAGPGHLGTGFVFPGALPGTAAQEGLRPEVMVVAAGALPDLRPVAAGPLDGSGQATGADLYRRYRRLPDTVGAVTLNPATEVGVSDETFSAMLDPVRLTGLQEALEAARRRRVLPASPPRRIGI